MTELGTVTRDHPDLSATSARLQQTREAWQLYKDWQVHDRRWQEQNDSFGRADPKAREQFRNLIGDKTNLDEAGQLCRQSVAEHLQALQAHDLEAAFTNQEITKAELDDIAGIRLRWEREQELIELRRSRDGQERER